MTPLERMWSGWRATYVASSTAQDPSGTEPGGSGSVFSRILASGLPDVETHIVHRGTTCFAILNAYPYGTGHLLVLPYREVADLELLSDVESTEIWSTVTLAVRAVKGAYRPDGVNVGVNLGRPAGGSVSEHLHVHVLPRWTGDANFMTAIANTRTLPEPLDATASKIRAAWPG
ncbi:MAG: HIT family protein [Ilumatobacteraceae bacterium]